MINIYASTWDDLQLLAVDGDRVERRSDGALVLHPRPCACARHRETTCGAWREWGWINGGPWPSQASPPACVVDPCGNCGQARAAHAR